MNYIDYVVSNYKIILFLAIAILIINYIISFSKKFTKTIECPYCKANDVERTQRGLFMKVIFFFKPLKKFKCLKCWKYFYVLSDNT
jgi:DNA-directed RNA polymerase subunit RPC12/RpoP